jgi:hypothetical protein
VNSNIKMKPRYAWVQRWTFPRGRYTFAIALLLMSLYMLSKDRTDFEPRASLVGSFFALMPYAPLVIAITCRAVTITPTRLSGGFLLAGFLTVPLFVVSPDSIIAVSVRYCSKYRLGGVGGKYIVEVSSSSGRNISVFWSTNKEESQRVAEELLTWRQSATLHPK